jgi:hypothetical protein
VVSCQSPASERKSLQRESTKENPHC